MNITELDSFNLADAIKFHDRLNHRLWDRSEHLHPKVHDKLMEIAKDFQEFLGVPDLSVKDITISGSNAAYNYTNGSDIDLHLVVDVPDIEHDEVYRELFNAKKYQYNDQHKITIGGADVELYAQDSKEQHHSQGIYSLLRNAWVSVPKRKKAEVDDMSTRSKYEDLAARIDDTIKSGDAHRMANLMKKIKVMRQTGLEQNGEFGADNLAFKLLRNNGYIKRLVDARNAARDVELSLAELAKPKQRVTYGFVRESEDGVNPTTAMFVTEQDNTESVVQEFIIDTAKRLGIKQMPKILIHHDEDWSEENHSFGMYVPEKHELHVSLPNRHLLDVLRTTAHELCHCAQNSPHMLPGDAGETGSQWENEAHAVAGIIMRDFADANPHYFQQDAIKEGASGYIPKNKKEAKDPRWAMGLSVDIKPGQVGKEANKLALHTGKNGEPGLLMKSFNLRESLDKPELTVPELAKKHSVSVDAINKQLAKGVKVELEHTSSKTTAREIALDHLAEFPDYYDRLQKAEEKKSIAESLAQEFALFEEDLMEIKMTSKNLAQLAKAIPGVTVGLEFEMIVPNTDSSGDGDMEPDYEYDENVRDIDDAVNFFDDGDYNGREEIRRLRRGMESDFMDWKIGKIDEDWDNNGYEFFCEYLDREEPFDEDDYIDSAVDWVRENNPELEPGTDEYQQAVSERLNDINAQYYVETWEAQGRSYDHAREEFEDERSDEYSEEDWLRDQGIYHMSDVENTYSIMWPHWTASGGGDADVKTVALNFMNYMGYKTIAVGDYHGYGGGYQLWNGDEWVKIGSNKPMDAFTVEPDGSLEGNEHSDTGLEFVSPPIPLAQIGETMSRVQQWAGEQGVYTGKNNKTSMHTNISIPGYDLNKLDYLKAAILLGDEHVLRQFDRIGNTYARPAIEKVKNLVQQKPEKAKELLDKMKSHLDAAASKLIHSGVTDKYTSINTKDNRIEYRSPGGDYLSDIGDNPQKMIDTINRMVVNIDAAMDPEKYKQEYQKKLYKILTGQSGGREAKTGAKQEMKASDKDLINIFSRYAAGELPKAALKSFVRQAQLQRKVARGTEAGSKMWWNVKFNGQRMEVVADSERNAKITAAREWVVPQDNGTLDQMTAEPLRPYEEPSQPSAQQAQQPTMGLWDIQANGFINSYGGIGPGQGRLIGGDDFNGALEAARRNGIAGRIGQGEVDIRPIPQEQPAQQSSGPTLNGRPSNPDGNYIIFNAETPGNNDPIAYRFQAADYNDALVVLGQWRRANPGVWDVAQDPNQTAGQPVAQRPARRVARWEIVNNRTGDVVQVFTGGMEDEATQYAMDNYGHRFIFTTRPSDGEIQRVGDQAPNFYIKSRDTDEIVKAFYAADNDAAHEYLTQWKRDNNLSDSDYVYGRVSSLPDAVQRNLGAPIPGSTLDRQRQRAEQGSGEYGVWIQSSNRFARLPADQAGGDPNTLRTFPSRERAESYLATTRAMIPGMRTDIEVREIPQGYELPPPLGRPVSPAFGGQQPQGDATTYEIYNRNSGAVINSFPALNDQQALEALADYRNSGRHSFTPAQAQASFGVRRAGQGQQPTTQFGANTPEPMYELVRNRTDEVVHRFFAADQDAAITQAHDFMRMQGWNIDDYTVQAAEQNQPSASDSDQGGIIDVEPNVAQNFEGGQEYRIVNMADRSQLTGFRAANQAEAERQAESILRDLNLDPDQYDVIPLRTAQPLGAGREFAGWKVLLPSGEEVYQFSGVGNSQADANRIAAEWLRNNGYGVSGEGYEVVPVWREA